MKVRTGVHASVCEVWVLVSALRGSPFRRGHDLKGPTAMEVNEQFCSNSELRETGEHLHEHMWVVQAFRKRVSGNGKEAHRARYFISRNISEGLRFCFSLSICLYTKYSALKSKG